MVLGALLVGFMVMLLPEGLIKAMNLGVLFFSKEYVGGETVPGKVVSLVLFMVLIGCLLWIGSRKSPELGVTGEKESGVIEKM